MIKGSGVFFDIDKFRGPDGMTREYFGPYAWRYEKTDETSGPDRYLPIIWTLYGAFDLLVILYYTI